MRIVERIQQGWRIGFESLSVLKAHRNLLLFPILSTISLMLVLATFATTFFGLTGYELEAIPAYFEFENEETIFIALFVYYLINYFVIVFFNVGLVHCIKMAFDGEFPTVGDGLKYSVSRIRNIFTWAVLAATVGVILKVIEDRMGWLGSIVAGMIGIVWSLATFFVVPIIANEDVSPIEAMKRSGRLMKEKWGEAVGANFSFFIFYLVGYSAVIAFIVAFVTIEPVVVLLISAIALILLHTAVAAAKMVFITAAYNHVNNLPTGNYDDTVLDQAFMPK